MRTAARAFPVLVAFVIAVPGAAVGDSDIREYGTVHFGISVGGGAAVAIRDTKKGRDVADPVVLAVFPSIGVTFGDFSDVDGWWRGQFDASLEGVYLQNFVPDNGTFFGAAAVWRYRFVAPHLISPYAEVGVGMGALDFDLQSQDDGFNFVVQTGVGLRWRISERFGINTSVRWHHISNAGTRSPNRGIDNLLGLVGLEFH